MLVPRPRGKGSNKNQHSQKTPKCAAIGKQARNSLNPSFFLLRAHSSILDACHVVDENAAGVGGLGTADSAVAQAPFGRRRGEGWPQ